MRRSRPPLRPMRRLAAAAASAALLATLLPGTVAASSLPPAQHPPAVAPAAPTGTGVGLLAVADVADPVLAIGAGDGSGRLFIVSKGGTIRILKGGTLLAAPFLDISANVSKSGEQGLLGLAFHPSFATNRRYFVNYTSVAGDTVIREYKASATSPDTVEPGSGRTILTVDQPYTNHNGGMIAFGPDGYLYIGMGDGGSGGDPGNRAQRTDTLLGKMLRISVNGSTATRNYVNPKTNPYVGRAGKDEIWQRGLRNPWRFSFDRATGNLWIGDVGQGRYEEVDRATRTTTGPGRGINWGWRVMEGSHCYNPSSGCNRTGKTLPLLEYTHGGDRCSVTGGYVYRGAAIPSMVGWYVYGDFCTGQVWAIANTASRSSVAPVLLEDAAAMISGFGQDDAGELYLCDLAGDTVYRIVPTT